MNVFTLATIKDGGQNVLLVASSIEKAQELAQERAHSMGLHIYRWADGGVEGYAAGTKYVIQGYELDNINKK